MPAAHPQWPYLSLPTSEDNGGPSSPSHPILSFEKTKEEGKRQTRGDGGGKAIQSSENVAKQD